MPIVNVIVLGVILSMFGAFMAALAWGAWWSNRPSKPAVAPAKVASRLSDDPDWGPAPSRGGSGW